MCTAREGGRHEKRPTERNQADDAARSGFSLQGSCRAHWQNTGGTDSRGLAAIAQDARPMMEWKCDGKPGGVFMRLDMSATGEVSFQIIQEELS
jgi:hypothetical protein